MAVMFILSLSYQKWFAKQWLAVGSVNGSNGHSSRRWHSEQLQIKPQLILV